MTRTEYDKKHEELLQRIPQEFREYFSALAWDKGHAYGYSEVIIVLDNMISGFIPYIKDYNKRHGIK